MPIEVVARALLLGLSGALRALAHLDPTIAWAHCGVTELADLEAKDTLTFAA